MPSIVKPKVTAVKKVTAPKMTKPVAPTAKKAAPPKADVPSWKRVDAQVGKEPFRPRRGAALQQGATDALARARAIIDQLKTFNPNSWGIGGPGTFQGIEAPKKGPSIQDIINNARR